MREYRSACTGLWNEAQEKEFVRIAIFVHAILDRKNLPAIGPRGARKGSTQLGWEEQENRPLTETSQTGSALLASPIPYYEWTVNDRPELDRAPMARIKTDFLRRRGARMRWFDMLELH